ncbi:trypsin-like serine peptidase [Nonomuraea ferruginea]
MFFVDGSGKFRWCSATSIQSNYRNLVATAGHCVYDTESNKALLNNWVFVPGYYQGKTPWGIYVGKQAFTHYDFDVYEDYDRDYAFVTVYNGIQFTGAERVNRRDYQRFSGPKRSWGGQRYILKSRDVG